MAERSSLVTAPTPAQMRKYILSVSGKVNDNEVVVDSKSNELQADLQIRYDSLASLFTAVAKNYRDCASKSVKGDNICSALKKVATNCENQGKYCSDRRRQLEKLYTYDARANDVDSITFGIENPYLLHGDLKGMFDE